MTTLDLAAMVRLGFDRGPSGPVTFRSLAGAETTGRAVGVPEREAWRDQQSTRSRGRALAVLPDGLAFAPEAGMTATWGSGPSGPVTWNVSSCKPLAPDGVTVLLYRVSLEH